MPNDINIFDVLDILTHKGIIEATDRNTVYCDCCETRHFRQWYRYKRTGDRFYVCKQTWIANINYISGEWGHIALTDLLNHLIVTP